MLCIQNQGHIHYLADQLIGGLTAQHMQEVNADGVVVQHRIDAFALVGEHIPMADDRWKQRNQAVVLR